MIVVIFIFPLVLFASILFIVVVALVVLIVIVIATTSTAATAATTTTTATTTAAAATAKSTTIISTARVGRVILLVTLVPVMATPAISSTPPILFMFSLGARLGHKIGNKSLRIFFEHLYDL
ncbi:MAG: hypothetical protein ACOVQN_12075 [Exiguobacterium sp.]